MRQIYFTAKEIKKLQEILISERIAEAMKINVTTLWRKLKDDYYIFSKKESDNLIQYLKEYNLQYVENDDIVIKDI